MPGLDRYRARLDAALADSVGLYRVPGAACGVLLGDETTVVCAGLANQATGVVVTPHTLFQVGSISKLYTTTLLLQAHAAGIVGLDEPVRAQLQEFSVADPGATLEITPRHLLTHTSGIEGDHLLDTGWNPDALERYVATLSRLGQIHAPDETYSFCNTGFGVAGRLIEVATGEHYDRALRRRLTRPLACHRTVTLPQHALMHRTAAGHVHPPGAEPVIQPRWTLTRSNGPMGGIVASADDILAFARSHIEAGAAAGGTELMPAAAVEAMAEPQVETPLPGEEQALGWTVRRWDGLACLAQDANTFGQRAFLRVVPAKRFAVCLLANSPRGGRVARDVLSRIAADLLDVAPAEVTVPGTRHAAPRAHDDTGDAADAAGNADAERLTGTYERMHQRVEVTIVPGKGLELAVEPSGVLARLGMEHTVVEVESVDPAAGVYRPTDPDAPIGDPVVFSDPHDPHRPDVPGLYIDGRLHRKV